MRFIEADPVYLRPLELEDVTERYLSWLQDPEVCRWNAHARMPWTLETLRQRLMEIQLANHTVALGVLTVENDEHIGNISLQKIDWINRSAEWAVLIGERSYWGRGITTRAGSALIGYGFDRLNLHSIFLGTPIDNVAMVKVARKMGMTQEGVRRQAFFKNGQYFDVGEFSILSHEYMPE